MSVSRLLPALFVGLALFVAGPAAAQQEDSWTIKTSPKSVADTVSALTTAVDGAGATVVAVVDHAASAKKAGMELPPTTLVIFGNPKLGTPLMQKNRQIAMDLPMRVLVWQDGDTTKVGYLKPESMASWYGIAADNPSIKTMTGALDKLTNAATAE
jgi:uncharacterized protein (DUF302 family)